MNIFVLDADPERAARDLCDRHVVKMCLETAQILSTITGGPYRPTHRAHPCVVWAGASRGNALWLREHGLAIAREYSRRYGGRIHASEHVIIDARLGAVPPGSLTPHVQCLPDAYRGPCAVEAYRRYYLAEKARIARWAYGPAPAWWQAAA